MMAMITIESGHYLLSIFVFDRTNNIQPALTVLGIQQMFVEWKNEWVNNSQIISELSEDYQKLAQS